VEPTPARSWRVSDLAASLIRTGVPVVVGAVLAWLAARHDIVIDDRTSTAAMPWIVAGTIGAYYVLARWLERRRGDRWPARAARWVGRWLLGGIVRQPVYAQPSQRLAVTGEFWHTQPPRLAARPRP
jgi:hypothetical protein